MKKMNKYLKAALFILSIITGVFIFFYIGIWIVSKYIFIIPIILGIIIILAIYKFVLD